MENDFDKLIDRLQKSKKGDFDDEIFEQARNPDLRGSGANSAEAAHSGMAELANKSGSQDSRPNRWGRFGSAC